MLFNSYTFIFGFLPFAFVAFYVVGRLRQNLAKIALIIFSLGFYAWWKPAYLPLLVGSILFNYVIGLFIQKAYAVEHNGLVRVWLTLGIVADVCLLGWFKYANFIVDNINFFGGDVEIGRIALPLAISFFTFQKIAYLVDAAEGKAKAIRFVDFALFASFFPPLIAGPIIHYKEIVPQVRSRRFARIIGRNVLVGLAIFAIGLFKKVVIADTIGGYANPLYAAADAGQSFGPVSGWLSSITYTLQLYFDFSGYSDMAIGLARLFGVKLPLNFHSPLRAANIIEYWRRWHMTLQRFLSAYVFQPVSLPLNRISAAQGLRGWSSFVACVIAPISITFLISGVWHGANWTFIIWGMMHAAYVVINEVWREIQRIRRRILKKEGRVVAQTARWTVAFYHLITLGAVVVANVIFRAHSVNSALAIWSGMLGLQTVVGPPAVPSQGWAMPLVLIVSAAIVFIMPNTQQIMGRFSPAVNWDEWRDVGPAPVRWQWRPTPAGCAFVAALLFFGIMFIQRGRAVFLYFNF